MKKLKLSHSSVKKYTDCPKSYKLHYIDRLRSTVTHSALLFGAAIDNALNTLVIDKDLEKAKEMFTKTFLNAPINKTVEYVPTSHNVVYSKTDFDPELLEEHDVSRFNMLKKQLNVTDDRSIKDIVKSILVRKDDVGIKNLSKEDRTLYALGHWLTVHRKGILMLEAYERYVLPRLTKVISIQKEIRLENGTGDEITGFIDMMAELDDGKRYILDHKTTTSMSYYDSDSPMRSQQLVVYYHSEKEEYNLNGVGFIVFEKIIRKNRKKKCSKCGHDGTGFRFETCNNVVDKVRCNGVWDETIDPKAKVHIILNEVPEAAEELVIETFDNAAEGINKEEFPPNLSSCRNGGLVCTYYNYCHNGDSSDLEVAKTRGEKK